METNKKQILSALLTGTTLMTLFSFAVSELEKNNYKEPHILGILLRRMFHQKKTVSETEGWIIHYLVGLLFVMVYAKLWETTKLKAGLKSGTLLGALSGIPAVLVWHATLKMHPRPPKLDLPGFYKQLVIAHMVFGAGAGVGYKIIKK